MPDGQDRVQGDSITFRAVTRYLHQVPSLLITHPPGTTLATTSVKPTMDSAPDQSQGRSAWTYTVSLLTVTAVLDLGLENRRGDFFV